MNIPMTTSTADLEGHGQRTARRVILWTSRALSYFVYAYLVVVEIILFLGFFLLLFGANPSAGFTEWVYRSLDRAMEPFRGIFTPIELGTTAGNSVESIFETSVLFAMIVYGIVGIAVHALITWLSNRMYRLDAEEQELLYQASLEEETARLRADATAADAPVRPPSDGDQPPTTGPLPSSPA
jgi:hypothetical protein